MSNEMYLIHGEDYLGHINDKVHLYSMLKQINHMIARLPNNRGSKELSMMAENFDAAAEEMFRAWGIPKTYLVFGSEEDLADLMANELIDPEDAGFVACDCACCEEAVAADDSHATDEDDEFAGMVASLANVIHRIFGNNVAVHIIVE